MSFAARTTRRIELIFFDIAKVPGSHWMIKSDNVFNLILVYLYDIERNAGSSIR